MTREEFKRKYDDMLDRQKEQQCRHAELVTDFVRKDTGKKQQRKD